MKARFPDFEFVYGDAEFTPDNHMPSGLVSLALHSRRGSIYMVNAEADREGFCSSEFRRDHIWSKLPLLADGSLDLDDKNVVPYAVIKQAVNGYFRDVTGSRHYRSTIGFVADHGTRDMGSIHTLFRDDWNPDVMPEWIPKRPFADLATLEDLAGVEDDHLPNGLRLPWSDPEKAHHALYDAKWDREVHEFLLEHSRAVRVASGVECLES
jgi:hypothetical protein